MRRIYTNIAKLFLFLLVFFFYFSSISYAENEYSQQYIEIDENSSFQTNIKFNNFSYDYIEYQSMNSDIADIDQNGFITSYSPGEVTIYARAIENLVYGPVITDAKTIIVKVNPCPVTSIKLQKKLTLNGTKSHTLSAQVLPQNSGDKTLTWSSSKTSVAVVNKNGKVTGISAGTAKITAKSSDGTVNAVCTVTVKKVALKKLTLSKNQITLRYGKSYTLKKIFSPANTTETTCKYKSSNIKVASVNKNGVITAKGKGTCTITITDKNKNKTTAKIIVPSPTLNDKIKSCDVYIDNEFIGLSSSGHVCQFKLYNKSSKDISFITLQIYTYNKNKERTVSSSSHYEDDIEISKKTSVTKSVLVNSSSLTARGCIISVKYKDGTTWENPYYKQWCEKYEKKYD